MKMWFYAINAMLNGKKRISNRQLQRETDVRYKCSWRMLNRIRTAMGNEQKREMFEAIVEVDETYVGGKPSIDKDKKRKRGRGTMKIPVVGVKERSSGRMRAVVAKKDSQNKTLTGRQLIGIIRQACKAKTTVIADEFPGYRILDKHKECAHL